MDSYYGKRSRRSVNFEYAEPIHYPRPAQSRGTGGQIILFLLAALLVCIAGALLVPAGTGAVVGYLELQDQNKSNAELHYQRGMGYLAENYPELAFSEFQIALKYDSTHEGAQEQHAELQAAFNNRGTPGAAQSNVAPALYEQAKTLTTKKEWSEAIVRLEQLRSLDEKYRAAEVTEMLYTAYVEGGKTAVAFLQIEIARERFDAALALRNNDPAIKRQRELATLYLEGQQYAGSRWDLAAQKFAAVHDKDPNYADVKKRLVEAHLMYGDIAMKTAPCLALRSYENAAAVSNDPPVIQKRNQASAQCKERLASPPTPTLSAAESYTWKILTNTNAACASTGDLSGTVRDAGGRGLSGINVSYSTDAGARTTAKTDANGEYKFAWGKDAATFRVSIVGADGKTPASTVVDVIYPGGASAGCHIILDWQKAQ